MISWSWSHCLFSSHSLSQEEEDNDKSTQQEHQMFEIESVGVSRWCQNMRGNKIRRRVFLVGNKKIDVRNEGSTTSCSRALHEWMWFWIIIMRWSQHHLKRKHSLSRPLVFVSSFLVRNLWWIQTKKEREMLFIASLTQNECLYLWSCLTWRSWV